METLLKSTSKGVSGVGIAVKNLTQMLNKDLIKSTLSIFRSRKTDNHY